MIKLEAKPNKQTITTLERLMDDLISVSIHNNKGDLENTQSTNDVSGAKSAIKSHFVKTTKAAFKMGGEHGNL